MISRICAVVFLSVLFSPSPARADAVLHWNEIAVRTMTTPPAQNPFAQARFGAIVQLAVFEAVNSITGEYEPYLASIPAPAGASAEAAAVAAAHRVLDTYFGGLANPAVASALAAERASSLAAIPDGQSEDDGVAVGEAAAAAIIANRTNDGSAPPEFFVPLPPAAGVWQATPTCTPAPTSGRGALLHWRNVRLFGISSVAEFMPGPPPALTSSRYARDLAEVLEVGNAVTTGRPIEREDVARFYASVSPTQVGNSAARQVATVKGRSLSENARELALLNMAISDALVVSFAAKYQYNLWRPETAIAGAAGDGNPKTEPPTTAYAPLIPAPCFPSYPSNHASGSSAATEMLRRLYGAAGHDITLTNPALPSVILHYGHFADIAKDVDDARVYGGIHFRFDQEGGNDLGRGVATAISKTKLQPVHGRP
jgi:hypothetical protein